MSWSRRGTENDSLRRQVRLLDELGSPCGLNADWWCRAWHVGGAGQPNGLESGLYVLDTEEPDGILTLVRRGEFDEDTGEVEVDVIAESHDPVTLIALAREIENGDNERSVYVVTETGEEVSMTGPLAATVRTRVVGVASSRRAAARIVIERFWSGPDVDVRWTDHATAQQSCLETLAVAWLGEDRDRLTLHCVDDPVTVVIERFTLEGDET